MINELVRSFESTVKFVERSVADLTDDELVQQPPGVPNHGMWTVGHLVTSCQGMAEVLGVEPWLPGDWEATFGYGSTPSPDRSRYRPKAEMLAMLADGARRLREAMLATDETTLRKPWPDEAYPTLADILLQVVAGHTAYHAGQLAVWRRAIGKPSAGVFI